MARFLLIARLVADLVFPVDMRCDLDEEHNLDDGVCVGAWCVDRYGVRLRELLVQHWERALLW